MALDDETLKRTRVLFTQLIVYRNILDTRDLMIVEHLKKKLRERTLNKVNAIWIANKYDKYFNPGEPDDFYESN